MNIKQLKKELKLSNKEIAQFFDLTLDSYQNSTAKRRYEKALCSFYAFVKSNGEKLKATNLNEAD